MSWTWNNFGKNWMLGPAGGFLDTESEREKEARRIQGQYRGLGNSAGSYNRIDPERLALLNSLSRGAYGEAMQSGLNSMKDYGRFANQNLEGNQLRQSQLAGQGAVQQGYALGLTNPFAMKQRAQSQVYDRFADQFGNLNTALAGQNAQFQSGMAGQLAQALNNNPQIAYQMLQDVYKNRLAALSGQAANAQNYGNLDDSSRFWGQLGTLAQAYGAIKGK